MSNVLGHQKSRFYENEHHELVIYVYFDTSSNMGSFTLWKAPEMLPNLYLQTGPKNAPVLTFTTVFNPNQPRA